MVLSWRRRYEAFDEGLQLHVCKWTDRSSVVSGGTSAPHLTRARTMLTAWMNSPSGSPMVQVGPPPSMPLAPHAASLCRR
jgi:hypothetical protein